MVILNSRQKNNVQNFGMSKIHLRIGFMQKTAEMH